VILALVMHLAPDVVGPAKGQGSRKDDIVFNTRGVPLAGASVHVCNMPATGLPCTPTAQIYSDPLLTQALANPTTTDGMGNYFFYAAPGQYEIEISGPGITTKQIPNVILPSDPSSPTFNSLSTTGGINAFTLNLSGNLTVNGNTTVVGNLASGTLNLTNQGTPPGAASTGTVNLYTKSADMRLYYKDQTGTEIGPIASASGAQTNVANTWTAPQNFDADVHSKGPNPWYDVMRYGGYIGTNYDTPVTGTISGGTNSLAISSALDFTNGNGILVWGAGPATGLATPQAPTVTPLWQSGSTSYSYCVASVDYYGGRTACSAAGSTATGPAAFGMQTYTINARSSTGDGTTVTYTTSAAHNIPTSSYHGGQWPQVEITGMSNSGCNGAFTLTNVPSGTTFAISQQGVPDATSGCASGSVNVLPEVELRWDNHVSLPVTNYSCSSNVATITVPTLFTEVYGSWPGAKFNISGSSDSTYNGTTFGISSQTNTTVTFSVTCNNSLDSGNFGGNMNVMQSHATKAHLIYRCTGSSCTLPANASNYAFVGVAEGDDTYFLDKGYGQTVANVDQGQYPSTAPTSAGNQYLDTTITAGAGTTTLTLANNATSSVAGVNVWHDNVPNIYAACAAMPGFTTGGAGNGGILFVPAPSVADGAGHSMFPIIGNLISRPVWANPVTVNCSATELRVAAPFWQRGTIEWNGDVTGVSGGFACQSQFYEFNPLACFQGYAYPLFHFEPNLNINQILSNMVLQTYQSYETGLLWDVEQGGAGTVGFTMNNVHTVGGNGSLPVIIKSGFGWWWNQGGWGTAQGDYASGRSLLITTLCGNSTAYQNTTTFMPYIFRSRSTYGFGTAEVNNCGVSTTFAGNYDIYDQVEEGARGPQWLFNTYPTGVRSMKFENSAYSDPTGGLATPAYDFTNSFASSGDEIKNYACGSGFQPLVAVNPNYYSTLKFFTNGGQTCTLLGIDPVNNPKGLYSWESLESTADYKANWALQLQGAAAKVGAGQIATPLFAPSLSLTTTCPGGNLPSGSYYYAVSVWDASSNYTAATGAQTKIGPTASITQDGSHCTLITQPALPLGSAYWSAYRTSGPGSTGNVYAANGSQCGPSLLPLSYQTITDTYNLACGSTPTVNTTSLQLLNANNVTGNILAATEATEGQCFSTAAPAACGSFIDGFVAIATGSSSVTVNTSAVTANSNIQLVFDSSIGSKLGVTCNTTAQQPYVSSRTAGTSFAISVPSNFSTNPGCIGFHIKN
jgi:hypothetical protein